MHHTDDSYHEVNVVDYNALGAGFALRAGTDTSPHAFPLYSDFPEEASISELSLGVRFARRP